MAWACMTASGTGSLIFINNAPLTKASRCNSQVNGTLLSARIPNDSILLDSASVVMDSEVQGPEAY